jgi:hypothetical protein
MNALKVMLVLILVILGLINRRHVKHEPHAPARTTVAQTAVNQELLQNAERLAQTLRQCKQTAHNNRETK